MDLYRITAVAEAVSDQAMQSIEQEMQLCTSVDEKYTLLVYFLGLMAAKYIALKPEQKLTTDIMSQLVTIEQQNWKEYDK